MWLIYKHTNLINGKVYIGQTNQRPENRWGKDGQNYDPTFKFGKAIKKYGWENFSHEIIIDNIQSQAEANELEKIYIKKYDSYHHGYNMTIGGGGIINDSCKIGVFQFDGNKKFVAHFDSIRNAAKSIGVLEQNISACLLGKQLTCNGFYFFKDSIPIESIVFPLHKYNREIICIETQEVFTTLREASERTNLPYDSIARNCARGCISIGNGFHFAYLDEYDDEWEPVKEKEYNYENLKKKIICVETGEIWTSIADCSREIGISVQNLSQNCCNEHKTAKGLHYARLSEFNENWVPKREYDSKARARASTRKKKFFVFKQINFITAQLNVLKN